MDADYCTHGCDYKKRVRLWGNLKWKPLPLCRRGCGKVSNGRHPQTAQKAGNKSLGQRHQASRELHTVPRMLVYSIAHHVLQQVAPI